MNKEKETVKKQIHQQGQQGQKEKRFMDTLNNLFIGHTIKNNNVESGFIKLMQLKSNYYNTIRDELIKNIDTRAKSFDNSEEFKEEIYDKLYDFFSKYFCESGSIYFRNINAFDEIEDNIYTNKKDVALHYRTKDMYYIKSETLIKDLEVEVDNINFYFDTANIKLKGKNERRDFIFSYKEVKDNNTIVLNTEYSVRGNKTKVDELIKDINNINNKLKINEEIIKKAFIVFKRQSEVDFFIHKNAKKFLTEQFNKYIKNYLMGKNSKLDETIFDAVRLKQIKQICITANEIIDFISQFEDEIRKIWEKPKFAMDLNYVISWDKIKKDNRNKILSHKNFHKQIEEWSDLDLIKDDFTKDDLDHNNILKQSKSNNNTNKDDLKKEAYLPYLAIDTVFFKDIEDDIIKDLEDKNGCIEDNIDGELIHSENWQALNTLKNRLRGQVQCIYIDPPFNLSSSDQFEYRTNYKDSCWATMLENRITLARNMLTDKGSMFVRCDNHGNAIVKLLMDNTFGENNFLNQIMLSKSAKITEKINKYHNSHDSLFYYSKNKNNHKFKPYTIKKENRKYISMILGGERWTEISDKHIHLFSDKNIKKIKGKNRSRARIILGKELLPAKGYHWALNQDDILEYENRNEIIMVNNSPKILEKENRIITDNWTDKTGYSSKWGFPTENNEEVLRRVILTSTNKKDRIMDFFLGIGTTCAVAQKLGRKWIGVEMADHFNTFYHDKENQNKIGVIGRIKSVISGVQSGISKNLNYKGSGAFKYYSLESYEELIKNIENMYAQKKFVNNNKNLDKFKQDIFINDIKLSDIIKLNQEEEIINKIDLNQSIKNLNNKQPNFENSKDIKYIFNKEKEQKVIMLIKKYLFF